VPVNVPVEVPVEVLVEVVVELAVLTSEDWRRSEDLLKSGGG
jgi:hypothetical protein